MTPVLPEVHRTGKGRGSPGLLYLPRNVESPTFWWPRRVTPVRFDSGWVWMPHVSVGHPMDTNTGLVDMGRLSSLTALQGPRPGPERSTPQDPTPPRFLLRSLGYGCREGRGPWSSSEAWYTPVVRRTRPYSADYSDPTRGCVSSPVEGDVPAKS